MLDLNSTQNDYDDDDIPEIDLPHNSEPLPESTKNLEDNSRCDD